MKIGCLYGLFYEGKVGCSTPVGVYPRGATPEGIQDLAGNVWEWCRDEWHENFKGAPDDGSAWTTAGKGGDENGRVLRGGSWSNYPRRCRSAFRIRDAPVDRGVNVGFRVASGT